MFYTRCRVNGNVFFQESVLHLSPFKPRPGQNFLLTKNRQMKKQLEPARRGLSRIRGTHLAAVGLEQYISRTRNGIWRANES